MELNPMQGHVSLPIDSALIKIVEDVLLIF